MNTVPTGFLMFTTLLSALLWGSAIIAAFKY